MQNSYFTVVANSATFYVGFTYNGGAFTPTPGTPLYLINLHTNYNTTDLARLVAMALNGGAIGEVVTTAVSSITANSWFGFTTANGNKYYVWYMKNSSAVDPKPAGYTLGITVNLTGLTTAAQVATATMQAINGAYFAVPDFRGVFLRGLDPTGEWDLDAATRFALNYINYGDQLGSYEFDLAGPHTHTINPSGNSPSFGVFVSSGGGFAAPASGAPNTFDAQNTETANYNTGDETRPVNAYIAWAIKY